MSINVFSKFIRFTSFVTIVTIALSACLALNASPLSAATEPLRWTALNMPTAGEAGGWVLAPGHNIRCFTGTSDGTLFACADNGTCHLFKSTDGGLKWTNLGNIQSTITALAVSPHDATLVYYATSSSVYRSQDGGKHFSPLPGVPGAGAGNVAITSLAVGWDDGSVIAAGTRDGDSGQYGGLYLYRESLVISAWEDTGIGNYDVYGVALAPDYADCREIIAVVTDETDTFVFDKISDSAWNSFLEPARLNQNHTGGSVAVNGPAVIAFPGSYNSFAPQHFFYTGISTGTGQGDVYKINCSDDSAGLIADRLYAGGVSGTINMDIASLAVIENESRIVLLAGSTDGKTCTSTDGGATWLKTKKLPTGNGNVYVRFAPDFSTTGAMYAASGGSGGGFSISRDDGITWNQVSLIDTSINQLVDIEPSPDYANDSTLLMITYGTGPGSSALWKTNDAGRTWERLLSGANPAVDVISRAGFPPQYGPKCKTMFIYGESGGNPVIWSSDDDGQSFRARFPREPGTGAVLRINSWVIENENTLYIGSFDGVNGMIYHTTTRGFSFSQGAPAGTHTIYELALSPDYANDGTILAANNMGEAFISADAGESFSPLPTTSSAGTLSGRIHSAFDPDFKNNHHVYASSDAAGAGFYRFTVNKDEEWQSINGSLPAGSAISGVAFSRSGVMYGVNFTSGGGLERCLNPSASGPVLETVTAGLRSGATLDDICIAGDQIWAMDTTNLRVLFLEDTLTSPMILVSPEKDVSGIGSLVNHAVKNITIDWQPAAGATGYEWQCAANGDFYNIATGMQGTAAGSYAQLPPLDPATVYYWRVRVSSPVLSPWSEKRSFTTSLDTEIVQLKPESPAAGAKDVPVRPVFQWTAVMGASSYELLAAANADFEDPVIIKINDYALPANAWECDVSLGYKTTYYWKVRALTASTKSGWSSAGVFTTVSAPLPTTVVSGGLPEARLLTGQDSMMNVAPPKYTPPLPPAAATESPTTTVSSPGNYGLSGIPEWLIYFIGGLLAIVMLSLIIIFTVVLKIKRF